MDLTAHHFQRLGAHAAAALAHRDHPRDLTDADLDKLVQLTASAAGIAARAVKGKPGWIWQQKLAAMYPQSPPTAPRRGQFLARGDDLEGQVRDLFAGDPSDGEPCWTCGHPAGARWGKSLWPLTDSGRYRNHATGGAGGYPACRRCRIAVWCLPWAVGYRSGSIVTISGSEALEADWARRQVQISREALRSGWTDWATGSGPLGMLRDLVCEAPQVIEPFEVQRWSSDNRGAWLSTAALTHPGMVWLRAVVEVGGGEAAWELAGRCRVERHPLLLAAVPAQDVAYAVGVLDDGEELAEVQASRGAGPVATLAYARVVAELGGAEWEVRRAMLPAAVHA